MWGNSAPNRSAEIDLRVGGRYRVARDAPDDDQSGWPSSRWAWSGVFVAVEPERRLVYTIHWEAPVGYNQTEDEALDEAATVTFEPTARGTRLVFEHVGIPDDGISAPEHGRSVAATLDDLAKLIEN